MVSGGFVRRAQGEYHGGAATGGHGGADGAAMAVDDALDHWEEDLSPIVKPLQALFERASSYAELEAGLDDLVAKMDAGPLADRLAKLQMKARGLGDAGDGRA